MRAEGLVYKMERASEREGPQNAGRATQTCSGVLASSSPVHLPCLTHHSLCQNGCSGNVSLKQQFQGDLARYFLKEGSLAWHGGGRRLLCLRLHSSFLQFFLFCFSKLQFFLRPLSPDLLITEPIPTTHNSE